MAFVRTFSFGLLLAALVGCGPIIVDPRTSGGDPFSYEFSDFNCSTGRQTFNSRAELCDGLRNSALNDYCASASRSRYFAASGCTGRYVEN